MVDVIVIGARCAGAPTAMLLARKGYRVLLVDQGAFPSDQVMSTHLVWPPGIALLDRWKLLAQVVASGCPALPEARFDAGPVVVSGGFPPTAGGIADAYAPRRAVLDQILVAGAVAAGAELRENCALTELLRDEHGSVCGAALRSRGASYTERAALVIGADGMRSRVARAVRPAVRARHPRLQGTYFAYWEGVPVERIEIYARPHRLVYAWPTNDDLTLVGVNWPARDYGAVRGDVEQSYVGALEQASPRLAEDLRAGTRRSRWIGGSVDGWVRRPHGRGWALVGDAGYHKDPVTAQGITDAFRDADLLAEAVDAGLSGRRPLDEALAAYETRRNETVLPMFEFTSEMARLDLPSPDMEQILAALPGNPAQAQRFLGVFAGTVPVPEFFSPDNLHQLLASPATG
jgi:2-polyprenyl-6-methoxyphenol hydroxylase-like FAD-dependent oxidoreductase